MNSNWKDQSLLSIYCQNPGTGGRFPTNKCKQSCPSKRFFTTDHHPTNPEAHAYSQNGSKYTDRFLACKSEIKVPVTHRCHCNSKASIFQFILSMSWKNGAGNHIGWICNCILFCLCQKRASKPSIPDLARGATLRGPLMLWWKQVDAVLEVLLRVDRSSG